MSRINTNVQSLVASRILATNTDKLNTSLERLSTGLRINHGKDDPAGLIASETLRSELTSINAAMENAHRADNLISVAEGALQEVSSLLLDLEGLVNRTANEAGLSPDEVAANQLQIDSILDTINRISSSTEFGGKKLLNGNLDYTTSGVTTGTNASAITDLRVTSARVPNNGYRGVTVEITTSAQTAQLNFSGSSTGAGAKTIQVSGKNGAEILTFASGTSAASVVTAINQSKELTGVSASVSGTGANTVIKFNSVEYGTDAFVSVEALSGSFAVTGGSSSTKDEGVNVGARINGIQATTSGLKASLRSTALSLDMSLAASFATQTTATKSFDITGGGADFSIGATLGINATASLGLGSVSSGSLGDATLGFLSSLGSGQANQLSDQNFETAQKIIRAANKQVSSLRGRLGAFQKNTLASTINSLSVAFENISAAESAIRDTDFAAETGKLTRSQILSQAATSTLQIANSSPQSVLSLLR